MCEGKCKCKSSTIGTGDLSVQLEAAREVSNIYLEEANAMLGDLDRLTKLLASGLHRDDEDHLNGEMVLMMVTAVIERYYEVFNFRKGAYVPMGVRMEKLKEAGVLTDGEASRVLERLDAMMGMFTTLAAVEASDTHDEAERITRTFIDKFSEAASAQAQAPNPDSIFVDTEGNA